MQAYKKACLTIDGRLALLRLGGLYAKQKSLDMASIWLNRRFFNRSFPGPYTNIEKRDTLPLEFRVGIFPRDSTIRNKGGLS